MNNRLNIWIRFLFPIFLALFLGTLIYMTAQFREPPGFAWYAIAWFVSSIFLIWEGGWWISRTLDKKHPWGKGISLRLVLQLLATNLLGILLFLGSYILLNWYENNVLGKVNPLGSLHILVSIAEAFIIVQIINSVQIGYQLLENWQKTQLEAEQFKKENVINRLEIVRQQINAQVLSDNFNELHQLIQESPIKSGEYLKGLSDQYQTHQNQLQSSLSHVQQALKEKSPTENKSIAPPPVSQAYRTRFLVRSGTKYCLIETKDIIAFYKDDIVLLFTQQGKKYPIDHSLEVLINQLPPQLFFRINRQCVIHTRFLGEMRGEGNQLHLTLTVPFPKTLAVSQRNVSAFKKWLNEE